MRVLEVIGGLGLGGAEVGLVRRLRLAPPDVATTVVSTQPDLAELESWIPEGVGLMRLTKYRLLPSQALARQVRALHPDVVVTHTPRDSIVLLASLPRRRDFPVVVVAHSDIAAFSKHGRRSVALAMRLLNRRADAHFAVSMSAAAGEQCRGARDIRVIPLGGEVDSRHPQRDAWKPGARLRWLVLGRLIEEKNLINLLRVIDEMRIQLRANAATVVIAGIGPELDAICSFIKAHDLSDLVTATGATVDPGAFYAAADALIVTSTHEGGPITLCEAALAGCHVASTPVGIAPEIVPQLASGILADSVSQSSIRDMLHALISLGEANERGKQIQSAQHWTVQACSQNFYATLMEVTARHRKSHSNP